MADYIAASIDIGGLLTPKSREALAEAIASDGASLDYGDSRVTVREALDAIDRAVSERRPLALMDDQANYGQFPAIEAACKDAKLSFCRTSEAKYEYDGEKITFNGAETTEHQTAQDGSIVIPLSQLKDALAAGTIAELITAASAAESWVLPNLTLDPEAVTA